MKSLPIQKEEAFARPFDESLLRKLAQDITEQPTMLVNAINILLRAKRFEYVSIPIEATITDGHFCAFYQIGVRKNSKPNRTNYLRIGIKAIEVLDAYLSEKGLEDFVDPYAGKFSTSLDFHPIINERSQRLQL